MSEQYASKNFVFRPAVASEAPAVWVLLQQAIARRKADGSTQWQDGYPNPEVVGGDLAGGSGYVMLHQNQVVAYCALKVNDEPEYARLEGSWLTLGDFLVVHRVALADAWAGKGLSHFLFDFIEDHARSLRLPSIKADTNFDNTAMLRLFEKRNYHHCGTVWFRGSPRRAYEKVLFR